MQEEFEGATEFNMTIDLCDLHPDDAKYQKHYSLFSNNWLLNVRYKQLNDSQSLKYEPKVFLLNTFDNSLVNIFMSSTRNAVMSPLFFFYHDQDFYVRYFKVNKRVEFRIYHRNSVLVSKIIRPNHERNVISMNNCDVILSPSCRYIYILEDYDLYYGKEYRQIYNNSLVPIYERRHFKTYPTIFELIQDSDTKQFKLEKKREIKDYEKRYAQNEINRNILDYY